MDIRSKPKKDEEIPVAAGQTRLTLLRYWLQVDRQTKNSYSTYQEAETAGKAIKAAYPLLRVSVYDAEKSEQTTLVA
jgi:hypothetical protein